MGLLDAWIGDMFGAYGSKPNAPYIVPTDTGAALGRGVNNNLNNFDAMAGLTTKANNFDSAEASRLFDQYTGGKGAGLFDSANADVGNFLNGEIPSDVTSQITNNAAVKSLSGGYSGGQMHGDLLARDLGLTSLDLQKYGVSALPSLLGTQKALRGGGSTSVTSMFENPNQEIPLADKYNDQKWNRDWLDSQLAAAPDPTDVAYGNGVAQDFSALGSIAGTAIGAKLNQPQTGSGGGGGM